MVKVQAYDVLPHEDCNTQKRAQFKGIRKRKWGSWGSEIRKRKWGSWGSEIGSYKTAELAARAYDAAVYCLRGPNAKFNFPDSIPSIPSAFTLTPHQIQLAAARYARDEFPSTLPSPHNNNKNNKAKEREEASQSQPSSVSDSGESSEERAFWESLFDSSSECRNIDNFPSIDDESTLGFIPNWQEEEQDGYISVHLWNF